MRRLILIVLVVLVGVVIAGIVWFTSTVSNFMVTGQVESKELIAEMQLDCPPETAQVSRPWGKAGWMVFCDSQGTPHGPWVAAESGKLALRGEYFQGERSGIWKWYDEGDVTKYVVYETDQAAPVEAEIQRVEPPAQDDSLRPGKLLEWPEAETVAMAEACRASEQPIARFAVRLDENAKATEVELSASSDHPACDQALRALLLTASWRSCEEIELQAPCTVQYVLSLPSKYHKPLSDG